MFTLTLGACIKLIREHQDVGFIYQLRQDDWELMYGEGNMPYFSDYSAEHIADYLTLIHVARKDI